MGRHIHLGLLWSAVLGGAALGVLVPSAEAANADYCVTCKNPDETYRCRVTGAGAKPNDALKLYCVVRTAKEGNHASCSAERATNECVGLVKVYTYDGPTLPENLTSDPRVRALNQKVERSREAFEKPSGEAPKSLFELGGRAVDASRKGLRNAGSAIGIGSTDSEAAPPQAAPAPPVTQAPPAPPPTQSAGATPPPAEPAPSRSWARRSYDCMASFFRDCGRGE